MISEKSIEEIKPAIVVVGYNRTDSIKRLLDSLNSARYVDNNIPLVISLDYSSETDNIINAINNIGWKHGTLEIKINNPRLGLRRHIIKCGQLSNVYGAVIVLEDDLVVSNCFYEYVYSAVNKYKDEKRVAGISLYSHAWNGYSNFEFLPQKNQFDVYWGQISISWGQCWTSTQWSKFLEWYDQHESLQEHNYSLPEMVEKWGDNSWGKYFFNYIVDKNLFYIIPYFAHSTNFSEAGEHNVTINTAHQVMLVENDDIYKYKYPEYDEAIKYDGFFERILEGEVIPGVDFGEVCVDLNNLHRTAMGKRYLLTMEKYDSFELIATYGLQMRPIEANVLRKIPGDDIFLYKINSDMLNKKKKYKNYKRISYEVYDIPYGLLLKFGLHILIEKIKNIFK